MKHRLGILLSGCVLAFVSCGKDGDKTNITVTNPNDPQQQEQTPPGTGTGTGPTVIINNEVENNVRIINNTRNMGQQIRVSFQIFDVDPVIHRQFIHLGSVCPTVINNDLNRDGFLDEAEVQQAVGQGVIALDNNPNNVQESGFPNSSNYTYTRSIPKVDFRRFVPAGQSYLIMVYGVNPGVKLPVTYQAVSNVSINLTVPIFCQVNVSPQDSGGTTVGGTAGGTTVGGTAGGTTVGGTTGVTTGGTTGGGTSGGTTGGGTSGGTTGGGTSGGTTGGGTSGGTTGGGTSGGTTGGGTSGGSTGGGTSGGSSSGGDSGGSSSGGDSGGGT